MNVFMHVRIMYGCLFVGLFVCMHAHMYIPKYESMYHTHAFASLCFIGAVKWNLLQISLACSETESRLDSRGA